MKRATVSFERLAHKRAVARKCSRRYRMRRRNGTKVLRVEIADAEQTLDAWVRLGLINDAQRSDNAAIEAALGTLARAGYRAIKSGTETPR